MPNFMRAQLDEIAPVPCPCGQARRAFATPDNRLATTHLTEISADARVHYHKTLTEVYVILECAPDAYMELDGERVPVRPLTAVHIKPGCRHRAVGRMRVLITAMPPFDPSDEWFDDGQPAHASTR